MITKIINISGQKTMLTTLNTWTIDERAPERIVEVREFYTQLQTRYY
jgi:hypothetical protein